MMFLFPKVVAFLFAYPLVIAGSATDRCVQHWLKTKPGLTSRFSVQQIENVLCKLTVKWEEDHSKTPAIAADDVITRSQLSWLQGVRKCSGKDCLNQAKKQRCRGRLCLKIEKKSEQRNKVSTRRPRRTTPAPAAQVDLTAPVDAEAVMRAIDPSSIDVSSFSDGRIPLSDAEVDDLITGPGQFCQFKRELKILCLTLIVAPTASRAFPKLDFRNRLKFNSLKRTCQQLQSKMETLDDCADTEKVAKMKKDIANECFQLLRSSTSTGSAKNFCFSLQDKLTAARQSFTSWQRGGRSSPTRTPSTRSRVRMARNRATTSLLSDKPSAGIDFDDPNLQFDDIDNVDFRAERMEYRVMDADKRKRFHDAMNLLKKDLIDGLSKYDLLVIYHTPQESPGAHWGPAFLPFHRELLKQLEVALREYDPEVAMPYWDSTLDEGLPNPADSILWTEEFFGNGDGEVVTGPFANWEALHELSFVPGMKKLYRDVGNHEYAGLYKEADIADATSRGAYEELTACVDPGFEMAHGLLHMFVGGYMADLAISPTDPSFFLHHSFVDFIWEEFRLKKQTEEQRVTQYPTDDRSCNSFHFGQAQMRPFSLKNIDGLSDAYTKELYQYYPRPVCDSSFPDCGSPYLYCDQRVYRCLSKIRPGGQCTGFEGTDICYNGVCSPQGFCDEDFGDTVTTPKSVVSCDSSFGCPSPDLFCYGDTNECLPKVYLGGDCRGFEFTDICYEGQCTTSGVCEMGATTKKPVLTCDDSSNPCPSTDFCDVIYNQCKPKLSKGENCQQFSDSINVCSGGECTDGLCPSPVALVCSGNADCTQEEFCLTGTCTPKLNLGESCTGLESIQGVCREGSCTNAQCQIVGSCSSNADCSEKDFCDTSYGECFPKLPPGEICEGLENIPEVCLDGECVNGVCSAAPGCTDSSQCQSLEFCHPSESQCNAKIQIGQPCAGMESIPDVCASGFCFNGVCTDQTSCTEASQCQSSEFCNTDVGLCFAKIPLGWSCQEVANVEAAVCMEGYCDRGVCTHEIHCEHPACDLAVSFCEPTASLCLPRLPLGQACTGFESVTGVCLEGECSSSGICALPVIITTTSAPSRECDTNIPCPSDHFCFLELYNCIPKLNLGGDCLSFKDYADVCLEGSCSENGYCEVEPRETKTTTTTPAPTSSADLVWFRVKIIRGRGFYQLAVPGATVKSTGLDVPEGYVQTHKGKTYLHTSYPYFTGAAVVPIRNPDQAGFFPFVRARVDVFDEMGRPCKPQCLTKSGWRPSYIPCSNIVQASTNPHASADPIDFRETEVEALKAHWDVDPLRIRRKPINPYLQFKCQ